MQHPVRHPRGDGPRGLFRLPLALLVGLCLPAILHGQVTTLPDAEYLVAGTSGLSIPPEACELSSPDPNVPRQLVCAGSIAQMQVAYFSAARGNGQPAALTDLSVTTQALFVGAQSRATSQMTLFARAALTPLARAFFAANPDLAIPRVPVRIPWAAQWQMAVAQASAQVSMTLRTVVPLATTDHARLAQCVTDVPGNPACSGQASGSASGVAQITVADEGLMRVEYSASIQCFVPGDANTHVCAGASGMAGGEPSTAALALSTPQLPSIDTSVAPESLNLPVGANLNDYFALTVSPNALAGWLPPPLFADGFE